MKHKDDAKSGNKMRWLLIIGLIGVMILILNSFLTTQKLENLNDGRASPQPPEEVNETFLKQDENTSIFTETEHHYEQRIKEILEKIVGVGDVEVMVTVDSTEEIIVHKDLRETNQQTEERDIKGATRSISDITRSGELVLRGSGDNEQPVILKTVQADIRGIIVVANGAENATVKNLILKAVTQGLDVPAHRVSISPRKQS